MKSKLFRNTLYRVYEDGRIVNTRTNTFLKTYKRILSKGKKERLLVSLYIDKKQKSLFIHRILAECFIPNPHNLPHVNHKDGNTLNNTLSNLEWCTAKENNIHAILNKLRPTKINILTANKIRKEHKNNSVKQLCNKYNLGKSQIYRIINNTAWIT